MFEPHIDDQELKNKIFALFAYRHFPSLVGDDYAENHHFVQQLFQLQKSIYHLDAHLEAHWTTSDTALDFHWKNMQRHLIDFGIDSADCDTYFNHIAKYQKHELDLRKGLFPMRFEMEYFYFYKSCDVKLLRRLIYEFRLKGTKQFGSLSDWRYFDLITEVNDDVEDVFEDIDFINGNRFLLSILMFGKDKTMLQFDDFIVNIKHKIRKKMFVEKSPFLHNVHKLSLQYADSTLELMRKNLAALTEDQLKKAKLHNHIKLITV